MIEDLRNLLGQRAVSSSPEDRACYSYDATAEGHWPDLVAFPTAQVDVIRIMRYAHPRGIPVVPHGAGSGCSGGGIAAHGGILVSFERMNRILSLDEELMVAVAEPGVITARFQKEAERKGLFYPPDPSSAEISTLGGNVAHGAGGLRGRKYGTTRDYIIGLQAVMADGELMRTGFCGPGRDEDLTGLLVGSEGTLALVTRMALRLIAQPVSFCTLLLVFPEVEHLLQLVQGLLTDELMPVAIEYMDRRAVACVRAYSRNVLPKEDGCILLVEFCGRREETLRGARQVKRAGQESGARLVRTAWATEQREQIWSVRRALSPSMAHACARKVSQDVCVPPHKLFCLLSDIEAFRKQYGLPIINFGHLGDGNLHVNVMTDGSDKELRQAQCLVEDLFRAVLALNGTLSGEHGIGLTKARYLSWELAPETLVVHQKVKSAFDPAGILNPDKILGPLRLPPWSH